LFCVTSQPAIDFCSVPNLPHFVNSSILLPHSGFQFLFFLGRVPTKPFRTCHHVS
jgi:hypothetical protein